MTDRYIDEHFDKIKSHASDVEARLDDSGLSADKLKAENRRSADGFRNESDKVVLIDGDYAQSVRAVLDEMQA